MSFNGSNGGGSQGMIVIALMACMCCTVCAGVGLYFYLNPDAWATLKRKLGFDKGSDDTQAAVDAVDPALNALTSLEDTTSTLVTDPIPIPPATITDPAPPGTTPSTDDNDKGTSGCGPNAPKGNQCKSSQGKYYICKEPWKNPIIKFNSKGTGPRCCADYNTKFDQCVKNQALEVKADWPYKAFYDTVNKAMAGQIKGGLWRGTCPGPVGSSNAKSVPSIMYNVRGSSSAKQAWGQACHPVQSGNGYKLGEKYLVYPYCATKDNKAVGMDVIKPDEWMTSCLRVKDGKKSNDHKVLWRK